MIAYIQEDGTVACCSKASSVPTGAQYIEVASVPDSAYREAWRIVNGEVVLDEAERVAIKIKRLETAIDNLIEAEVTSRGYKTVDSIAKYTGFTNMFQAEAEALSVWVASIWVKCYELLGQWQAGTIPEPTEEEVIAQLPALVIL
jgi:hypothetical protein